MEQSNLPNSQACVYQMINHMLIKQPIPSSLPQFLFSLGEPQQLSKILLVNQVYNGLVRNQNMGQPLCSLGQVLYLRGCLLKHFTKSLRNIIPAPIFFLISFDFYNFSKYCTERGLNVLLNHSKGIYPQFDASSKKVLQFLPFSQQQAKSSAFLGNDNYQLSQELLKILLDKIKANVPLQKNQSFIEENNKKQILYILAILCRDEETVDQLIYEIIQQQQTQSRREDIIEDLLFWKKNYFALIEDGYKYYLDQEIQQDNIPVLYDLNQNNVKHQLMNMVILVKLNNVSEIRPITSLINSIFDGQKHLRCLIKLSYFYKISNYMSQDIFLNTQSNEKFPIKVDLKQIFYQTLQFSAVEEPFYSLFFSEQQLLQLYKTGKLSRYPTLYNYGPHLMRKILRQVCTRNPLQFLKHERFVRSLTQVQQIRIYTNKNIIGNFQYETQIGFLALQQISANIKTFSHYMSTKSGKPMLAVEAFKKIKKYVETWEKLYIAYETKYVQQLCKLYSFYQLQNDQSSSEMENQQINEDRFCETELKYFWQRPDTIYWVLQKIFKYGQNLVNTYPFMIQIPSKSEIKYFQESLNQFMHFTNSNFLKHLLQLCRPPKNISKKGFQDSVWRVNEMISKLKIDCFPADLQSAQNQNKNKNQENKRQSDDSDDSDLYQRAYKYQVNSFSNSSSNQNANQNVAYQIIDESD